MEIFQRRPDAPIDVILAVTVPSLTSKDLRRHRLPRKLVLGEKIQPLHILDQSYLMVYWFSIET